MASVTHLAKRFAGSLSARPPSADDESWALAQLRPGERLVWRRMSSADRRHAVGVARRTAAALGRDVPRPVLAAAVAGRERLARGQGRFGQYLRHDELGAELLADGDSEPLTIAWTAQHHRPESAGTVPRRYADALKAADDD